MSSDRIIKEVNIDELGFPWDLIDHGLAWVFFFPSPLDSIFIRVLPKKKKKFIRGTYLIAIYECLPMFF